MYKITYVYIVRSPFRLLMYIYLYEHFYGRIYEDLAAHLYERIPCGAGSRHGCTELRDATGMPKCIRTGGRAGVRKGGCKD